MNQSFLNEFSMKPTMDWLLFFKEDFRSATSKYNNLFALEPDHVS